MTEPVNSLKVMGRILKQAEALASEDIRWLIARMEGILERRLAQAAGGVISIHSAPRFPSEFRTVIDRGTGAS